MADGDLTTLDSVKEYLGISLGETDEDPMLSRLISAQSALFCQLIGRNILSQSYAETLDGDGSSVILPEHFPVVAVTSLTVDGEPQDFTLARNPDRIELESLLPYGTQNVVLTYEAGFEAAPKDVEQAVIDMVAWVYRRRDREGQRSRMLGDGSNVTFMVDPYPPHIQPVIDAYRRIVL